jgi:hypothetical protein
MEAHPERSRPSGLAIACLAAALGASAALLLYAGRDQVIREDAMFYAFRLAHDPFGEAAFTSPLNLYLIALPLALYRVMFEVFGLGADLPYRLVSTALVLACGVLFYALVRRRIGDLAAILPTALVVLFGATGEVVASAIRIPMLIAIAAGLGALLALERRDLRGDLLAATLLVASVLSHPVALGFLLATAVVLCFRPPSERWTRAWIVLIPGLVFAVWWAFLRTPAPGAEARASLGDVVQFGWDSWVSVTAAASGLSGVLPDPSFEQPAAKVLAVVVLALLAAGTIRYARRVPPIYWAALAALATLLVAPRLGPNGWVRLPDHDRYLYPDSLLLLLAGAALVGTAWRARAGGWRLAAGGVLGLALVSNAGQLIDYGPFARSFSERAVGQYSAYELAGSRAVRDFRVNAFEPSAGEYLEAAADFGSAADSPAELQASSSTERAVADPALVGALGIDLRSSAGPMPRAGPRPIVDVSFARRTTRRGPCIELAPRALTDAQPPPPMTVELSRGVSQAQALEHLAAAGTLYETLTVPALATLTVRGGGLWIGGDLSEVAMVLRRFADQPIARIPPLEGRSGLLAIPPDAAPEPWRVSIGAAKPLVVCGLPSG